MHVKNVKNGTAESIFFLLGNQYFKSPPCHLSEPFFRQLIDFTGRYRFTVRPFGNDTADRAAFQSQHRRQGKKRGVFHFIIGTADMAVILKCTAQSVEDISAETVVPLLSRPETSSPRGAPALPPQKIRTVRPCLST